MMNEQSAIGASLQQKGSRFLTSVIEREQKLEAAERSVLDESHHPIAPSTLIDRLKKRGLDEYSIRAAIWILIGDGKLTLTPARHLVSR